MKIAYQKLINAAGTKEVGEDYLIDGTAKAWGYVNEAGTTIRGSLNISSWTDTGTGDGIGNYTANMSDALYTQSNSQEYATSAGGAQRQTLVDEKAVGSITLEQYKSSATIEYTAEDLLKNFIVIGDLA